MNTAEPKFDIRKTIFAPVPKDKAKDVTKLKGWHWNTTKGISTAFKPQNMADDIVDLALIPNMHNKCKKYIALRLPKTLYKQFETEIKASMVQTMQRELEKITKM